MIRFVSWAWLGICAFLLAGPFVYLVMTAGNVEADVWEHLVSFQIGPAISNTLFFALGSALIAALIGTAWATISLFYPRHSFLFSLSMALLLAMPTYVFGFLSLSLMDYSGPLQKFLITQFGETAFFEPRTLLWAIFFFGVVSSPYVYFSVLTGLQTEVKVFLEASTSLGAGFWKTWRKILFPSLAPWIAGGALLAALEASADFGFIDLFSINTLSRVLYKSWGGLFSIGGAARVGIILLVLCGLFLMATRLFKTSQLERTWTHRQNLAHLFGISRRTHILLCIPIALGLLLFNIFPITTLIIHAFDSKLWSDLPWMNSLISTITIGSAGALGVGIMASILFLGWRKPKAQKFLSVFMMGYGLPGTLLAVACYLFLTSIFGVKSFVAGSFALLPLITLVYFAKFSGIMIRGLQSQNQQLEHSLFEAASTLRSPAYNFRKVLLPLFSAPLILGFFLLFFEIVKELPATLMIKPLSEPTLALRIHQYAAESDWPRASVFSLVLLILIFVIALIYRFIERLRHRGIE